MRRRKKRTEIPDEKLVVAVRYCQKEFNRIVDNFNSYEMQKLREAVGPGYSHVSIDDLRIDGINIRKSAKVGRVNGGHGPSKPQPQPAWYTKYLLTDHWLKFRQVVLAFWKFRCAVCDSQEKLEVHHRTYENLGHEELSDCIALCSKCHKVFHSRRKWASGGSDGDVEIRNGQTSFI